MRVVTNIISQSKKLRLTGAISMLLGIGLVIAPAVSAISISGPSDCDNNAIISCGAHSTGALVQAYNGSGYVQKVYAYFGISNADMANLQATNVAGRVTRDGKVFVDGRSDPVATNAVTGGRQNIAGSTQVNFQGITFFKRPPSVSFQQNTLPAFVSMKNGQFQFAIIASCGNAVRATPTMTPHAAVAPAKAVSTPQAKPAKPTPAPAAPTQSQSQSQQQSQQVNVNNSTTQNVQTNTSQPQPTTPTPTPTTTSEQPATQQTETQPSKLVNTGPTGLVSAFLVSSLAGVFGFRRFILHKFNN